ncbi:MAG: hypothetical protein C0501_12320 [Isosphaera sp.]|nr:hypothetical protein [Isosphaera sp.]
MPLYDHFHGDLGRRPWESFHSQWAGCIAADLNRRLPKRFVADAPMHLGMGVAADVAEYEKRAAPGPKNGAPAGGSGGGVAVATEPEIYAPPEPMLSMPAEFPTEIKVEVRDATRAYRVVGVVELVSPGNKKEEDERERFAAKCWAYLGKGIGLVVIDIVTERHWNLHNEFVRLAAHDDKFLMPGDPYLYTAAYRPVHRKKEDLIDLWTWPLAVGAALPAVPLALKGFGCVRLDLEATYAEACERSRIP